jgi:hypothetical protein
MSYATTKPAWLEYTSFGATPPAGFDASNPLNWCGSCAAVQEMLADLGFYMGEFDGNVTGPVRESLESFAQSKGMSTTGGITAQLCAVLKDTWLKQQGGGALPIVTRLGVKTTPVIKPRLTIVSPKTTTRIGPTAKPDGSMIGDAAAIAACAAKFQGWDPTTKACAGCIVSCAPCAVSPSTCDSQGKIYKSYASSGPCDCGCGECVSATVGGDPIDACILSQGTWDAVNQTCILSTVAPPACSGWWSCMSTGGKVAIVGGGAAVLGLGLFLALRK